MVPLPARMWSQAEPPMSGLSGNPRRDSMRSTSARRRSSPEPSGRATALRQAGLWRAPGNALPCALAWQICYHAQSRGMTGEIRIENGV